MIELMLLLRAILPAVFGPDTICIGLSRVGAEDQVVAVAPMAALGEYEEMGPPLHSLIICGESELPSLRRS